MRRRGRPAGGAAAKTTTPSTPNPRGPPKLPLTPRSHKYLSPPIDHRELQGKNKQRNDTEVKIFSQSGQDAAVP